MLEMNYKNSFYIFPKKNVKLIINVVITLEKILNLFVKNVKL